MQQLTTIDESASLQSSLASKTKQMRLTSVNVLNIESSSSGNISRQDSTEEFKDLTINK